VPETVIDRYYAALNAGDAQGMLACVTDDMEHRVNEDGIRQGKTFCWNASTP
jgi:ketosteroid isomerase-like protein